MENERMENERWVPNPRWGIAQRQVRDAQGSWVWDSATEMLSHEELAATPEGREWLKYLEDMA